MSEAEIAAPHSAPSRPNSLAVPLRIPLFRRIWLASLLSNFGLMIQSVGSAWAMTQMTGQADKVALVQTALMFPVMIVAIPAGAIADMFDRRKVGLVALLLSFAGAAALTLFSVAHLLTPWLILAFCGMIGTGMALFAPAWQSSVAEQVPTTALPQAVALNSISYNIARSFGPAIGGVIVATAGVIAAFASNAILYLPLIVVMFLWKRVHEPPRLPPENLFRAVTSGIRYVAHNPTIRVVLVRTLLTAMAGGSISALMPIVARDLLHGNAQTYGLILGAFGIGAVIGALSLPRVRARMPGEAAISIVTAILAACILIVAFSGWLTLTGAVLIVAGSAWMIVITILNVAVQLSVPRWVAGRALAAYQAATAGGIAIGSWLWGRVAQDHGVATALICSAIMMLLTTLIGRWRPLPVIEAVDRKSIDLGAPETSLALTPRSGPILIEIEYLVDPDRAREFYLVMQKVRLVRHRNGGHDWTISRDLLDPRIWRERYNCPTWLDYLRMRSRLTAVDRETQREADALHIGGGPLVVRRMLERPFGSVRWHPDTPDRGLDAVVPMAGG